tara:strand:+ start:257 stop:391 length:135 start_codon:yes stop_codon:yes gene_type:complete
MGCPYFLFGSKFLETPLIERMRFSIETALFSAASTSLKAFPISA